MHCIICQMSTGRAPKNLWLSGVASLVKWTKQLLLKQAWQRFLCPLDSALCVYHTIFFNSLPQGLIKKIQIFCWHILAKIFELYSYLITDYAIIAG